MVSEKINSQDQFFGQVFMSKPDAWQWKFKHHDGTWSDWHDGKVRSWAIADGREYKERPLYALSIPEQD